MHLWIGRLGVTVERREVHVLSPCPGVAGAEQAHQVGRDRHLRSGRLEQVALRVEAGEHLVVGEAGEVQLLGGVGKDRSGAQRGHLVEGAVALALEGGTPRLVELGQ